MKCMAHFRTMVGLSSGVILLFSVLMSGCHGDAPIQQVDLNKRVSPEKLRTTPPRETLRVAVSAMLSAERTFEFYHALLDYLGEYLQMPITFKQRRTYEEINLLLERGELDLAFICSGAYVALTEQVPVEIMGVPVINGEASYQSFIIVPKDSPVRSLADLQGKRFAFTDPLSNTGKLYATYRLAQMGTTPDQFFKGVIYTNAHDRSIEAVAQHQVDGASVDSRAFEQLSQVAPELIAQVRVIEKSPPLAMPPVVFGPTVSPKRRQKIRQFFLHLHEDPRGRTLLGPLRFDRFISIADAAYDPIREMRRLVKGSHRVQAP